MIPFFLSFLLTSMSKLLSLLSVCLLLVGCLHLPQETSKKMLHRFVFLQCFVAFETRWSILRFHLKVGWTQECLSFLNVYYRVVHLHLKTPRFSRCLLFLWASTKLVEEKPLEVARAGPDGLYDENNNKIAVYIIEGQNWPMIFYTYGFKRKTPLKS